MKGKFVNCYGIKDLILKEINFSNTSNRAIIYAPNGVMKTSFAKTMQNLVDREKPKDLIYDLEGVFELEYRGNVISNNNVEEHILKAIVIQSLDESYISPNISTLLVNNNLKKEYDEIINNIYSKIKEFEKVLNKKSKIPSTKIKQTIIKDFELDPNFEWIDILEKIEFQVRQHIFSTDMSKIIYNNIFNDKTEGLLRNPNFINKRLYRTNESFFKFV